MRRIPLFPLPVVLFPGAVMPLHIFEPRYRQMVARCLEYDRRFGLVYHDPDRLGPFEASTERVGTVARIGEFRILPDGRSLLLAHGEERFRIVDGIESDTLYLEALIEPFEDEEPEGEEGKDEGGDPGEASRVERRRRTLHLLEVVLDRLAAGARRFPGALESEAETAGTSASAGGGAEDEGTAGAAGGAGSAPEGPAAEVSGPERGDVDTFAADERPPAGTGEEDDVEGEAALPPFDPAEDISFSVAAMIRTDPLWQHRLLETATEEERLDQIDALLREALAAAEPDPGPPPTG